MSESPRRFETTRWSLIQRANDLDDSARQALSELCQIYWFPVYGFIRRKVGQADVAEDLTQQFFQSLIEKKQLAKVDPEMGLFRNFMMASARNLVNNFYREGRAAKRGGDWQRIGLDIALDYKQAEQRYRRIAEHSPDAENLFERQWAHSVLSKALERLRLSYQHRDRSAWFDWFRPLLVPAEDLKVNYREIARQLGCSENQVKVEAHRCRKEFGRLIREVIRETVVCESEIDEEISGLFQAFA